MNKRDAQRLNDVALNILDLVHCMHTGAANEITFEAWRDMFASGKEYEAARKQWQRWKEDLEENGICERVADGREDHVILKRNAVEVAEALHAEAQAILNEGKVERRYPDQVTVAGRTYRLKVYGRAVRPLTDREYAELRASIVASGRIEIEVLVDRRDNVVDGKHRLMIAAELGLTDVPIKVLDDDPQRLEIIAVDVNAFRRHLTKQQIAELKRQRQERARAQQADGKTMREIAEAEGVDVSTIQRDLKEAELPSTAKVVGKDGVQRPARKATVEETATRRQRVAELFGSSGGPDEDTVREVAVELGVTPRTVWRDVKALGLQRAENTPPESTPSTSDYGIVVHEVRYGETCLGIDREAAPLEACLEAALGGLGQVRARVEEPELVELVDSISKVVESVLWRILEGATT